MRQWTQTQPTYVRLASKRIYDEHTVTLSFAFLDPVRAQTYSYRPGQFNIVRCYDKGHLPLSISGFDRRSGNLHHTLCNPQGSGQAMQKLHLGDMVALEGPYGNGWPLHQNHGRKLLFVGEAGGVASLRPAIEHAWRNRDRYQSVQVVVAHESRNKRVFGTELASWRRHGLPVQEIDIDTSSSDTPGPSPGLSGCLTDQLNGHGSDSVVMMCGSDQTLEQLVDTLANSGVHRNNMYVSLASKLRCGEGKCHRCGGDRYKVSVCQDGPVFSWEQLA